MNQGWYAPTQHRIIGSRRLIKFHTRPKDDVDEVCLAGYYGEIWLNGDNKYKAVITSTRVARKVYALLGLNRQVDSESEAVVSFTEVNLKAIIKLLRIPKSQATQIRLASTFGKA